MRSEKAVIEIFRLWGIFILLLLIVGYWLIVGRRIFDYFQRWGIVVLLLIYETVNSLNASVFCSRIVMFNRSTVVDFLAILINVDGSKLLLNSCKVGYRLLRGVCGCRGRYLSFNRLRLATISCHGIRSTWIISSCHLIFSLSWRRHGSTWFLGLHLRIRFSCKLFLGRWRCLLVVRLPVMVWLAIGTARLWKLRQI